MMSMRRAMNKETISLGMHKRHRSYFAWHTRRARWYQHRHAVPHHAGSTSRSWAWVGTWSSAACRHCMDMIGLYWYLGKAWRTGRVGPPRAMDRIVHERRSYVEKRLKCHFAAYLCGVGGSPHLDLHAAKEKCQTDSQRMHATKIKTVVGYVTGDLILESVLTIISIRHSWCLW